MLYANGLLGGLGRTRIFSKWIMSPISCIFIVIHSFYYHYYFEYLKRIITLLLLIVKLPYKRDLCDSCALPTSIRNLKQPDKGQKVHFDDSTPGIGVRISKRYKSFVVYFGRRDYRRFKTLGRYPEKSLQNTKILHSDRTTLV